MFAGNNEIDQILNLIKVKFGFSEIKFDVQKFQTKDPVT